MLASPSRDNVISVLDSLGLLGRSIENVLDREAVQASGAPSLCRSRIQLLMSLARLGSRPLRQLALLLGLSEPAASQAVDALVREKLLARTPDLHDRRALQLVVTPAGEVAVRAIERAQMHRVALAMSELDLDDDQWRQVCGVFEALAAALSAGEKPFVEHCLHCETYPKGGCVLDGVPATCRYRASLRNKHRSKEARPAWSREQGAAPSRIVPETPG
jgi:DNA-binding MarR family transcriptional regulator